MFLWLFPVHLCSIVIWPSFLFLLVLEEPSCNFINRLIAYGLQKLNSFAFPGWNMMEACVFELIANIPKIVVGPLKYLLDVQ